MVNIAMIGVGAISGIYLKNLTETFSEVKLIGVCDLIRERAENVIVRYLDLEGVERKIDADGLLAVCLQHEIDHLDGKVFVEHLSLLKQTRIKAKLAKQAKITA